MHSGLGHCPYARSIHSFHNTQTQFFQDIVSSLINHSSATVTWKLKRSIRIALKMELLLRKMVFPMLGLALGFLIECKYQRLIS